MIMAFIFYIFKTKKNKIYYLKNGSNVKKIVLCINSKNKC